MQPSDYLQDVPYPHYVQRESTPLWLSFVSTALGLRSPDISQPYAWCELGCGQGLGAVLNAASNPQGRFVAIDLNPQHIAHGRGLAKAAGLDNLQFIEADFMSLASVAAEQSARYDFIVLNGVYSWVSAAQRQAIRHCVRHWLKPGGILYLGYMCQPGMAFLAGFRSLLRVHAQQMPGNSAQRVQAALGLLERMAEAGAGFFSQNPAAHDYLKQARQQDPAYLAHELLNSHWESLPVAEVMAAFKTDCGCDYMGSATPLENIDALSIPGNLLPLLSGLQSLAERESFKDLARNQSERRDLYQKGLQPLDESSHRNLLLDQVLSALPGAPQRGGLQFDTRIGPVQGAASLFSPLLEALVQRPCRFAELLELPALHAQRDLLSPALQMLAWAGHLQPLLPGPLDISACQRLNRLLSERCLQGQAYGHIAAPSLGASLSADPLQMAILRVLLEYPSLRGPLLLETVRAVQRDCRQPSVAEDTQRLARFEQQVLPHWQRMGIVAG